MKARLFFLLPCLLFALPSGAQEQPRASVVRVGFIPEHSARIPEALAQASWTFAHCSHLKRYHPEIRAEGLRILREEELILEYDDDAEPDVCAHTASGLGMRYKIYLAPAAFRGGCYSLSSTIFHEVLHLTSFWLSEERIQEIQLKCLNNGDFR